MPKANILKMGIIALSLLWVAVAVPLYVTLPEAYHRIAEGGLLSDLGAIYGSLQVYWGEGGNPFSQAEVQHYFVSRGSVGFLSSPFFYSPLYLGVAWPLGGLSAQNFFLAMALGQLLFGAALVAWVFARTKHLDRLSRASLLALALALGFGYHAAASVAVGFFTGFVLLAALALSATRFQGFFGVFVLACVLLLLAVKWVFVLACAPLLLAQPRRVVVGAMCLAGAWAVGFIALHSELLSYYSIAVAGLQLNHYSMNGVGLAEAHNVSLLGPYYRLQKMLHYSGITYIDYFKPLSVLLGVLVVGFGAYYYGWRPLRKRFADVAVAACIWLLICSPLAWSQYMVVPMVVMFTHLPLKSAVPVWQLSVCGLLLGAIMGSTALFTWYDYPAANSLSTNLLWVVVSSIPGGLVLVAFGIASVKEQQVVEA